MTPLYFLLSESEGLVVPESFNYLLPFILTLVNFYGSVIDNKTLRLVNEYTASSPSKSDKVDSDVRGTH